MICLTGGPRGPIGMALKGDHAALAEEPPAVAARRCSATGSMSSSSGSPATTGLEAATDRSRLPPRTAAGRDQRGVLS